MPHMTRSSNNSLIPNHFTLCESNEYLEHENFPFITITRGLSTSEQQRECIDEYRDDEELGDKLAHSHLMGDDVFEMWIGSKLAGLCKCDLKEIFQQNDEVITTKNLHLEHYLSGVFLLKKYRNNGLGAYFSSEIGDLLWNNLSGLFLTETYNQITHVDVFVYSEYTSLEGEGFHEILLSDLTCECMRKKLKSLGVELVVTNDSSI
jgi:hypothetical protein